MLRVGGLDLRKEGLRLQALGLGSRGFVFKARVGCLNKWNRATWHVMRYVYKGYTLQWQNIGKLSTRCSLKVPPR